NRVEVLKNRVEVLENRVEVLENRVEVLESRVEVLESRVEVLKNCVEVLQTLSHRNQVHRCVGVARRRHRFYKSPQTKRSLSEVRSYSFFR
ncbi:DUF4988 domain-containing protein, partial [Nostoc commune]|uniref:DUF4988 domain-containing protein n=1 Tax=Nostoc commune TaxID=1178 RepID=UPI001E49BDED